MEKLHQNHRLKITVQPLLSIKIHLFSNRNIKKGLTIMFCIERAQKSSEKINAFEKNANFYESLKISQTLFTRE
jgi:hypothetical protein